MTTPKPLHQAGSRPGPGPGIADVSIAVGRYLASVPHFESAGHTPLRVAGAARGWVNRIVAEALRELPRTFRQDASEIALLDEGLPAPARSALLQVAAEQLRDRGLVPGWRGELYALSDERGEELLRIERAAFRVFGLQSHAVHINGSTADGRLWISRRSPGKATDPGKLDNFAAGGLSAGEDPDTCAIRELWEEAGVPAGIACRARDTCVRIRSLRTVKRGVHDEILLCYDIDLPDDFVPTCNDGEVAEFFHLGPGEVAERLVSGEFTWDAGLVTCDWLKRRGLA